MVSYNRGGKMYDVRAKACVMACWNMFIPYLVPELPAAQKEALAYAVKGPLVYTSVGVRNWKAWQKLGVSYINAPTMYHPEVSLTEAVSLGDLKHPQTPDEPIALHLVKIMSSPGKPSKEQHRTGRANCWPQHSKRSSETFAINWRACWARAASIRRVTSSISPSTAGRTATPTPTTASSNRWSGYSPTRSAAPM